MVCSVCGSQNVVAALFCSQCGTPLPRGEVDTTSTIPAVSDDTAERVVSPVDPAKIDGLAAGNAMLIVQRGPGSGSRFLLDADVVHAGRHPESDIFLDDVTVSRRHAELIRVEGGYAVSDAGSLNGTYVNRDRIDRVLLKDGDEVQIGKFRLVYYAGHEVA